MNRRLTDGTTTGDLVLLQPQIEPQGAGPLLLFAWTHFLAARSFLHLSVKSTSPR
jgi:hypothetical protein